MIKKIGLLFVLVLNLTDCSLPGSPLDQKDESTQEEKEIEAKKNHFKGIRYII